jgi:hypothetical protein
MSALDGLRTMGVVLNPPYVGEWPHKVGQYMLNFGAIELISYQHLILLEPTRERFNENLDRLLGERIKRLLALLEASARLTDETKNEIRVLWGEASELAVWRNRIAHNPILPTWKPGSDSEHSPPDLLGVPDMKQLKVSNVTDSISIEGMNKLIDASADLGQRLHNASKRLQVAVEET